MASKLTGERTGIALALASAVTFGTTTIFAKLAYEAHFGLLTLLSLRFGFAALLLGSVSGLRQAAAGRRPKPRTLLSGLLLGMLIMSVQAGLLFAALAHLEASIAILLFYTYPILVALAALALGRESLTTPRLVALGLAVPGVALVLIAPGIDSIDPVGVTLALGSALAYTAYVLLSDNLLLDHDPLTLAALASLGAGIAFGIAGATTGRLSVDIDPLGWLWLAALVLVATVFPLAAFLGGIARIGPSAASTISTLEPLTALALALLVLGERLIAAQVIGAALVVAAVITLTLSSWRLAPRTPTTCCPSP